MDKGEKTTFIIAMLVWLVVGFLVSGTTQSHITQNPKTGEEYQVLSITIPQKETAWIGMCNKDVAGKIIIALESQNKNRIIF